MAQIAKAKKVQDARNKEHLQGKLITKCCELVDSAIRMASHMLEAAHLEFEALLTVLILVNANFLATAIKAYTCKDDEIIDTFLDEVKQKTKEFIKNDQKDVNAN